MLKALDLAGFKSFADKTRFEFPPGITVVVGPNGSGKSNVVDAMKWVLGEQSARSLRGKEMADVIFKGSGNGQRKPANTAEATIVFDNSGGLLDVDAPEVYVTRRVYRGGEGEYLINGQPCRLKDIKQLFRGTGVGTDAYSLIEQGKVDSLLQASALERRAIFEEAAGISRFKAKKLEAERRMARVDQNLLRLSDIVDEVDGRLRKLRSQATKARRYQEYSDRLQQLRTQVAQADWIELSEGLRSSQAQLATCVAEAHSIQEQLSAAEATASTLEQQQSQADAELRAAEADLVRTHERCKALDHAATLQTARITELNAERDRASRQARQARSRSRWLLQELQQAAARRDEVESLLATHRRELDVEQQRLAEQQRAADQGEQKLQELRHGQQELQQRATETTRELARAQAALETAERRRVAAVARRNDLEPSLQAAQAECQQLDQQLDAIGREEAAKRTELETLQAQWKSDESSTAGMEARLKEIHDVRIALTERIAVLQEFEQRREGIGDGVRAVLDRCGPEAPAPFRSIRGIVADLIDVADPGHADVITVALADRAQHIVVEGGSLLEFLQQEPLQLPGRVGFLRIPTAPPPAWPVTMRLEGEAGVIGRADEFVVADADLRYLVQWLLGDTWVVDSLAHAVRFSRLVAAPLRFVTRQGELLERDGRILVGPPTEAYQWLSRRSEQRELQKQLDSLRQEYDSLLAQCDQTHHQIRQQRDLLDQAHTACRALVDARTRAEVSVTSTRRHVADLVTRVRELEDEIDGCDREQQQHREDSQRLLAESQLQQAKSQSLSREIDEVVELERLSQAQLSELRQAVNAIELLVSASVEQGHAARQRYGQLQQECEDRLREDQHLRESVVLLSDKLTETELAVLNASAQRSELVYGVQSQNALWARLHRQRSDAEAQLRQCRDAVRRWREQLHDMEQRQHGHEMEVEKARLERQALAERLREDYGFDLSQSADGLSPEEQAERAEVDQEIIELRRKLNQLGAVNMDALEELNDLEARYEMLAHQYRDLTEAKNDLERIIQRINTDSRRLYAETLEAVRANFQVLFRKVFGGGRADIVLEEDKDLLESGIEIVATPPGKHSLSLSLLSGGERALTAVTLLLALFQYRPSPFCVLDEVDGPLDEANIGRFVGVLREFLTWTKFIVVTHSKKTMTAANTLYGVTMQESGVSKRVSVRFEDVNEQGEILRAMDDEAA